MSALPVLTGLAVAAVVAVLATGVAAFVKGGPWYQRHATHLLHLRVVAQGLAVALLAFMAWLAHRH